MLRLCLVPRYKVMQAGPGNSAKTIAPVPGGIIAICYPRKMLVLSLRNQAPATR